jgi:predicted ATP-binding protein involved in virulence
MRIESAHFENFPPFADGKIEFPAKPADSKLAEVHFLVGANGAGKTRLLCLLAAALGSRTSLQARVGDTKYKLVVAGSCDEWRGIWSDVTGFCGWVNESISMPASMNEIHTGTFQFKGTSPTFTGAVQGLKRFDSTRYALAYDGVARMSHEAVEALKPVALSKSGEHLVFRLPDEETRRAISQSLTNLKMRSTMDAMQNGGVPSRAIKMCSALESTLAAVTGKTFSFTVTHHPKVSLNVTWGDMPNLSISNLPDGLRSVLSWLAATVGKLDAAFPDHEDPLSLPIVLLVDEPEGHLHPGWQRLILPATQRLFPNAQIFVATHSPFMVSSVNEGFIHILEAGSGGKVTARPPMECQKGDTYQDVLEDVLGMTDWYDPETEGLLSTFRKLRDEVIKGAWDKLPELEALSQQIADRGQSLNNMMGREMAKVNRAKPV